MLRTHHAGPSQRSLYAEIIGTRIGVHPRTPSAGGIDDDIKGRR